MPRLAANLSMLWQELDPYERFGAAESVGFRYVEMLFPQHLDADRVKRTLSEFDLQLVLFDPAAGDWGAGERGLLCLPGREEEFLLTIKEAIDLAIRLGTLRLNALVGIVPAGVSSELAHRTALFNLRRAAPLAQAAGITLLVEAINNIDVPGYWAGTVRRAAELVEAVDHPSVRLQLDQYHAAMAGEEPIECLRRYVSLIEHVQIADVPGRHQPGTGGQRIDEFLNELDRLRYSGFVGLEYRPFGTVDESLDWVQDRLRASI